MQGLWNLIGKGQGPGRDFNYEVGDVIQGCDGKSVWTIHSGKSKANGNPVTVFICDAKIAPPDEFQVAKNACKRLRTIRHPNMLRYIDSYESDALIYMVTEEVIPLVNFLEVDEGQNESIIAWGIHQIATALSFLVNDSNLCHGNINIYSVFVDPAGEWKLGAVEYVHGHGSDPVARLPSLGRYDPPEGKNSRKREKWSIDAWGFGCLIWEIFNGPMKKSSDLQAVSKIPRKLLPQYCELVTANPKSRLNPKNFQEDCKKTGQYFDNDFVRANLFLQEIQIKDISEQKEFFQSLNKSLDSFPVQFSIHKILPELLKAFQFGAAGSSVLGPLFKIGKLLEANEYQKKIVPCVVKLFSSNDRATRIQLLQQMDNFVHHLQPAIVNDQVFPNVATGFGDTLPAMREQTVKSMILLAPKLSEKTINSQLLRYFAKLQMDEQPGIRTNTTICLGKIAASLPQATRQKVLIPAFLRSLRDPFPPARSAGILALAASQDFFPLPDIASKVLPALCVATMDNEKTVRDNVFKAIKTFLAKLEDASNNPESHLNIKGADGSQDAGSSSSWTGWAVSSLTSRIYGGQQGQPEKAEISANKGEAKGPQQMKTNHTVPSGNPQPQEMVSSTKHSYAEKETFGDSWVDENWDDFDEDDTLSSMREDLVGAKNEVSNFAPKTRNDNEQAGSSDSDYGDWGSDDWGFDERKTTKKPKSNQTKQGLSGSSKTGAGKSRDSRQSQKSVADMLGMAKAGDDPFLEIGSSIPMGSSQGIDDLDDWPHEIESQSSGQYRTAFDAKPFAEATQKSSKTTADDANEVKSAGWDLEEEWEGDGWADMGGATATMKEISTASEAKDKEAKKAELMKKREERKQQREKTMRERKTKGGGALKLGGVKKVAKDTFD